MKKQLEGKLESRKSAEKSGSDCGICFCPVEEASYTLQSCRHEFCLDCLKGMPPEPPMKCPTCGDPIILRDILALFESSLAFIKQRAVYDYIANHPDQFIPCMNANKGCPQYLPRRMLELSDTQQAAKGGHVMTCELCMESFCFTCNSAPHKGLSCAEQKFAASYENIRDFRLHILEEICNTRCPRCKQVSLGEI